MKIQELFDLKYGVNLELMTCEQTDSVDGINFVGRTANNNGVVATVKEIKGVTPQPAGTISCASGGSVLEAFVQVKPYYSGRDLYVLAPKKEMTLHEKLFYCMCIRANAYRYTYGRQANKTLKDIELPNKIPDWVYETSATPLKTKNKNPLPLCKIKDWVEFKVSDLFTYERGIRITKENRIKGNVALVTAGQQNLGVAEYINGEKLDNQMYSNRITIDMFGNAHYHKNKFYCDDNILVLNCKIHISVYIALFICTILNKDDYRYSYGRQYRQKDLEKHIIKLPAKNNQPDWEYMEQYVKSLPYSDRI